MLLNYLLFYDTNFLLQQLYFSVISAPFFTYQYHNLNVDALRKLRNCHLPLTILNLLKFAKFYDRVVCVT